MEVRSKRQFFMLWEAGVLGNRNNIWRNWRDAYVSHAPMIGFREIGKAGGGKAAMVPHNQVVATAFAWEREQLSFITDDTCPNDQTTLCGEVCRSYRGLDGLLAEKPFCGMRAANDQGRLKPVRGATILALVDRYMDPSSQDDLWALLDLYPDATVEFSCFTRNVGIFPHRNTLFWETRNY